MHVEGADAQGRNLGTVEGFRTGILIVPEGTAFLRRERGLWALALVPVLLALVAVVTAVSLFWMRIGWIHTTWASALPVLEAGAWWSWIWVGPGIVLLWLVGWIGVVLAFALSLIAALLCASLLSAPFLDRLSQRVEAIVKGERLASSEGFSSVVVETARSFLAELQRLGFFVSIWLGLSLIGFVVPGAHLVTAPLLVASTLILLPLDYAGFALDRRQIPFAARRRWLWANLSTMIGFGGVGFIACLIPGLNLLMMPALVTAGTLLVLRLSPSEGDAGEA
jgi:CysZ protein